MPDDLDGDGLPDAWELHHLGSLHHDAGSLMPNGQTARQHYVAGTDPTDAGDGFKLKNPTTRMAEESRSVTIREIHSECRKAKSQDDP